jgi:amino acid permease
VQVWSWVIVSLGLLVAASGLMVSHVRTWRAFRERGDQIDGEELDYRRSQYRRRMQTSAMLGILAVAMLVGRWIKCPPLSPTVFTIYWGVVMLVVFWLGLLAVADIISTKYHYGRIHDHYALEEAKLRAELRRLKAVQGNGEGEPEGRAAAGETDETAPP